MSRFALDRSRKETPEEGRARETSLGIISENGLEDKSVAQSARWPAPGSEDTELVVLMELEVGHGEAEVHARVQA